MLPKRREKTPLDRDIWFKIKSKAQNSPDNNTPDSLTPIKETETNLQRLIKTNLPETVVWARGASVKGLSHSNSLRHRSNTGNHCSNMIK